MKTQESTDTLITQLQLSMPEEDFGDSRISSTKSEASSRELPPMLFTSSRRMDLRFSSTEPSLPSLVLTSPPKDQAEFPMLSRCSRAETFSLPSKWLLKELLPYFHHIFQSQLNSSAKPVSVTHQRCTAPNKPLSRLLRMMSSVMSRSMPSPQSSTCWLNDQNGLIVYLLGF